MKRLLSIALVILFSISGLTVGAQAKPTVKITYKSLAWLPLEQEMTRQVIAEWNKAHPEIQVQYSQGDWGTVQQDLLTSFETGDVPDIFHYWTSPIMEWKEKGLLADLTPMLDGATRKDVKADVWKLFSTKDNKVTALPFQFENDVIFYNVDMFKAANIKVPTLERPWSFAQMRENALKLTDAKKGIYGLGIGGLSFASRFINETWATKRDLTILVKTGDSYSIRASQEYIDLCKWIRDLALVDKVVPIENVSENYSVQAAFENGKVAMIAGLGNWMRTLLLEDSKNKKFGFEWGMLPALKEKNSAAYGAIQTLSIPEKSKYKAEAMEFLKFFWNTENQARIAMTAMIFPGRLSSQARPEFNTKKDGWDLCQIGAKNLVVPEFITVPGWGQFIEGDGRTLYQQFLLGKIDDKTFALKLAEVGTKSLKDAR